MAGSDSKGKWEASTVIERTVKSLRSAGYLAGNVAHCIPEKDQVIPVPKAGERVVFLPHFIRGLVFPLHPFVRGLLFFYGLDFHDLVPNSILQISAFIVVCEAFLRVPHTSAYGSKPSI